MTTRQSADRRDTVLLAMVGIGLGLYCVFSHLWDDDKRYIRRSKFFGTEEVVEGRALTRSRQAAGGLFLVIGIYSAYCLMGRKAPLWSRYDYEPQLTHRVVPKMPAEMKQRMISGRVTIEFVVDELGTVTAAKVYHATHAEFGAAALAAVNQWKFLPAMKGDRPKPCRLQVPIDFNRQRPFQAD